MAFSCPSYCCPPLFDNNSKSTRFKACRRPGPSLAGAPPLRTELASDAGGWTPRSAASANVAHGSCSLVCTGCVIRQASWSPRWLDASHSGGQSYSQRTLKNGPPPSWQTRWKVANPASGTGLLGPHTPAAALLSLTRLPTPSVRRSDRRRCHGHGALDGDTTRTTLRPRSHFLANYYGFSCPTSWPPCAVSTRVNVCQRTPTPVWPVLL